jgi:predicted PurR-regulated permease PerM
MASFFTTREGKLRFIRIANDIEEHLASYVATVTIINFGLGVVVAIGAWLFGFPNPVILGLVAMVLNYIPYIGPACTTWNLAVWSEIPSRRAITLLEAPSAMAASTSCSRGVSETRLAP